MQEHHIILSSTREKIIEHVFAGELLKRLWHRGARDVEVLRCEVDSSGYDVVLEHADVVRHFQLKSSFGGAHTSKHTVSLKLQRRPSGCVLWIVLDPKSLELVLCFGSARGGPVRIAHFRMGTHTKDNAQGIKAERPNTRVINRGHFRKLNTLDDLVDALFGREPLSSSPGHAA